MSKNKLSPELWVERYSDYFLYFTISKVSDREMAKDIVSETFLAGLKSKDNFKGEASEKTWLISILKRKIIDYYRKINSNKGQAEVKMDYHTGHESGDWLEEQVSGSSMDSGEEAIENKELGQAIYDCLEQINPKHAKVFKMKSMQEMDTEVICNELKISSSNFWVMIHRARTALVNCMGQTWFKN
ncbi:sigma-70 family RNA polymerase sigma factor [Psychroflexus aestuariivivens]|uniref:sigma-70 family RNA polymerase sigma factor n=1 Tax=Psychroflexus aestuariivivens TaxID=1795040 RepID=UPI000FD7376A|nr:sigma-70 family RNA polymerase sigma factor [Psychroflexus aestuariivivens]